MNLHAFLTNQARGDLLPWSVQVAAAQGYDLALGEVEETALVLGLLPARYQRNRQTIGIEQQLRLCRSKAVIIGSGGLGGYLVEELARLGVGRLVVIDPDVFEEHNLNRQLLSSPALLGEPKVKVAAARVGEINPAVTVTPRREAFGPGNARELLAGADVVLDGLDTITARLELAQACSELALPLVHGAIGGWYGQVATQLPGEEIAPHLFGPWAQQPKGVETRLGNPSFTPAVVASLQVAEACKILLGQGELLSGRFLFINLYDMEFAEIGTERHREVVGQ